jgi:hypothetical protein
MLFGGLRASELCIAAVVLLTASACGPSMNAARTSHPSHWSSEITRPEVDSFLVSRSGSALDLIRHLRPGMLVARDSRARPTPARVSTGRAAPLAFTPTASRGIRVYLDHMLLGGIDNLTTISSNSVLTVRWLSPIDATTRYGTGHADGVIEVTTRQ